MGKIPYCPRCGRVIEKPKRKLIDSFRLNIYIIIIIATLGIALIPFLFYRYGMMKKHYCPDCQSKLTFYSSRSELPGGTTPFMHLIERVESEKNVKKSKKKTKKEEILQKVEEKKLIEEKEGKKKVDYINCPFCNKKLERNAKVCTYCGTELE